MYDTPENIASLISTRICHDLASPLGAIANGLELMGLSDLVNTPEMGLISDSVDAATARIDFFRMAFGAATESALISPIMAQDILNRNYADRKLRIIPTAQLIDLYPFSICD
jgi:histidine phosphotransferase ChpT